MNVDRMRALVEAIRGVDEPEWMKWRRIPVVKHGVPNQLLMAYCCSGLQDSYTAIYTDKHAVINRTDGDHKWRLAAHFGVSDELVGRIFGTDGCGGAITPKACAEYVQGLIDAHEQAIEDLVLRGQQFAQDVIAGLVYPKGAEDTQDARDMARVTLPPLELDEEDFGYLPPPEYLDTREEGDDITPTPKVTLKKK